MVSFRCAAPMLATFLRTTAQRWMSCALLSVVIGCTSVTGAKSELTAELVASLDTARTEEEGANALRPYLDDLKQLEPQVVERVVLRQWWVLAKDIVTRSHAQQVDLSFSVRKAVRILKDEADELLRTLNPKYGLAQQVAAAFQWAQNDTCVFLTVKFTVRWNAPGALEVTEPVVTINATNFNFTGLGKHSNNKYRYTLSLDVFDNVQPKDSTWSLASVGKLSVTLRKRWPRKWPRLLVDKKTKIQNMHVWMEMQDRVDAHFGGMTAISNSPLTCALSDKLYCLATDTCKYAANCTQCPGKNIALEKEHMCSGMPTEKASLSFKDTDMDENELGGEVQIIKARNEFDIDTYSVYFGGGERVKLSPGEGNPLLLGETKPTGSDAFVRLPHNTAIPEGATHLLVFSQNAYGEYDSPGNTIIRDAVLPKAKPDGLDFDDTDGQKNMVSGTITIHRAANEHMVDEYVIHWGKSPHRKLASSSELSAIPKSRSVLTYYVSKSTKIPEGATHLLVFTKNEHGEYPSAAALKLIDHTKPCLKHGDEDCVVAVSVVETPQLRVSITRAKVEASLTEYELYWGKHACGPEGLPHSSMKNGNIKALPVGGPAEEVLLEGMEAPAGSTHILAFSRNRFGESGFCASAALKAPSAENAPELKGAEL